MDRRYFDLPWDVKAMFKIFKYHPYTLTGTLIKGFIIFCCLPFYALVGLRILMNVIVVEHEKANERRKARREGRK